MNKKLMAVAVAGALAAPAVAFAQASNVTVYGRANLGLDSYEAKGATAGPANDWARRTRVYDAGSRFGLTGQENLGGGLKAVFLMENGVAMDTGSGAGQNGNNNTSVGLAARIGYVGLEGGWGRLTFGRQNVFWTNGEMEQWQANYGSVGNQFFTGGMGRQEMNVGVARQSNTMMYTSPVFSGISAEIDYSPNAQETCAAGLGTNGGTCNGSLWALSLRGNHGAFMWGYDGVQADANKPATGGTPRGIGNKLKGGWKYQPGAQVSLFYVKSEKKNSAVIDPAATAVNQSGWGIVWEHTWGNFHVEANYSTVSDIKGCSGGTTFCNDTKNNTWFLGGRYLLSKRTWVLAYFLDYRNSKAANADPTSASMSSVSGTLAVGADPRLFGVGILHNF